uniref:enoyl-CoA hydratase/isomerase family protein n=1 Tax=Thaumasiovibrio occultus TaxID=1891184 RepID=UPI000B35A2D9|nr:enoyl-CoA hydratase/isomerase family protein [Thaumasiovibrio occultus]
MKDQILFSTVQCGNGLAIGVVTLNNPTALNALTFDMLAATYSQLKMWLEDPFVVAVLIDSSSDKAFCAGGDVKTMYHQAQTSQGKEWLTDYFSIEYRCDHLLHRYPKPVIAWGHGIVMGGGMGLFMGASHRVVTSQSRLAMPEINIGLYPDVGGTWFLNRLPEGVGLFLAMTGAPLNAVDALDSNFATVCIDNQRKSQIIESLCQVAWSGDDNDFNAVSVVLERYAQIPTLPSHLLTWSLHLQQACRSDSLTQCIANLDAIENKDPWLENALATLQQGSGITAHICFRQLNQYQALSLEEVFKLELALSVQCVLNGDFQEGVRALLVEKTKDPHWRFPRAQAVPESYVDQLFTPPWPQNPLHDLGAMPGSFL